MLCFIYVHDVLAFSMRSQRKAVSARAQTVIKIVVKVSKETWSGSNEARPNS